MDGKKLIGRNSFDRFWEEAGFERGSVEGRGGGMEVWFLIHDLVLVFIENR